MNVYAKSVPVLFTRVARLLIVMASASLVISGCSSMLINDPVKHVPDQAIHCSGSETVDDSSIAVLPVPVVAFVVPHADLHDIKPETYLQKCGESAKLVNRKVEVSRMACIPAGLSRIITLGIWQWCPANVSWEADILE